jgi:hypothetical protein
VATRRPLPIALPLAGVLALMAVGNVLGLAQGLPTLLLLGFALFSACYLMITGQLANPDRMRSVITVVFGLIHGFGFAADLLQMQIPTKRLAELLVGFNCGVEIGQLALVLGLTLLAAAASRMRLSLPRPLVVDVAASFLVGLGTYWFVTRSYGF